MYYKTKLKEKTINSFSSYQHPSFISIDFAIRFSSTPAGKRSNTQNKRRLAASITYLLLEASRGFEPLNEGFADPCLTTWPRRRFKKSERAMRFELTTFSLARRRTTTVLRPRFLANFQPRVPRPRIELGTPRFSVACSTN